MTNLNELSRKIYNANKEKGFYDEPREIGTLLMLVVSELSEALEADRKNNSNKLEIFLDDLKYAKLSIEDFSLQNDNCNWIKNKFKTTIKDSFEDEIADAMIRLLDLCGHLNIDIEKHIDLKLRYNETRPYKHDKKY